METEALGSISPFKAPDVPTQEEIDKEVREQQLAMQPDLEKFEKKAKAMERLKKSQDAARQKQLDNIYK